MITEYDRALRQIDDLESIMDGLPGLIASVAMAVDGIKSGLSKSAFSIELAAFTESRNEVVMSLRNALGTREDYIQGQIDHAREVARE
jgi:hypothetical protein